MRFFHLLRTTVFWVVLAVAVIFFVQRIVAVWFADDQGSGAGEAALSAPVPPKSVASPVRRSVGYRRYPPYPAYEVVAERDLFANDRREAVPEVPAAVAAAPGVPSRPLDNRFALFGIVIEGGRKRALVSNLNRANALDKEYVWVVPGDQLGNLTIAEIARDEIVVTEGGNTHVVALTDASPAKQRRAGRTASSHEGANVIQIRQQAPPTNQPAAGTPGAPGAQQ